MRGKKRGRNSGLVSVWVKIEKVQCKRQAPWGLTLPTSVVFGSLLYLQFLGLYNGHDGRMYLGNFNS